MRGQRKNGLVAWLEGYAWLHGEPETVVISIGVNPLFVARQTGTSLEMIDKHYGSVRGIVDELDGLISTAQESSRNPTGRVGYGVSTG